MKTEFRRYENLNYVYALPDNYDSSKKYPAILFLHGAGTRGDNIEAVLGNG
jgi:predicted peptidase